METHPKQVGGGFGAPGFGGLWRGRPETLDRSVECGACSRREDEVYRNRVTGKGGSERLWKPTCNCG